MDLTSLSLGKLNTLNQRIAREIEVRERVGKADVIKKLRKLAAAEGFTLEELLSLPQQAQATPPANHKSLIINPPYTPAHRPYSEPAVSKMRPNDPLRHQKSQRKAEKESSYHQKQKIIRPHCSSPY